MKIASHTAEPMPAFQSRQLEFAAHIRNPDVNPAPADVEDRRMAIYRELFFNNMENFISSGFPVLRTLYSDTRWHRMIRDFFATHRCASPLFMEISQEFLTYLQQERQPDPEDPPFLVELAHYEWVELALSISTQEPGWTSIDPKGDLLEGSPVLSTLAWLLNYQYPVHRISAQFIPKAPGAQPTYLMVYRDCRDQVGFMEMNPVTARLVTLIEHNSDKTGRQLLEQIAQEMEHPNPEAVIQGGKQTLMQLRGADIVLGTHR